MSPQQNQSASPGQTESLELPTTPATSREWHGRAPRKSAAATFSVPAGSCRDDLRKRSAAEVVQLYNGSRQKIERKSSNQNKAGKVKGKKISHIAEGIAHQYVEGSSRGNAPALMSACNTADQKQELRPA